VLGLGEEGLTGHAGLSKDEARREAGFVLSGGPDALRLRRAPRAA
jgi:hypothetical protein